MKSDIQIAQEAKMLPITEVAAKIGLFPEDLELYGKYKAKISEEALARLEQKADGKLILVTAVNPTPAGEGKTTVTVGLGQAMAKAGKKAVIALREPSLGPVFGVKGGAAGGGYAQVLPMEDINLHFTGDMHAVTSANNLLCAMLDNSLQQKNPLQIDPRRVLIARSMDMNDRALRHINIGLGGKANGVPREDGFVISVASEVMAILCLASDPEDLKRRLGNVLVAYSYGGEPIFARDLKAQGAMAALLKDAIKPNLAQTLENTPAFMHGGPFANIAHGCNSVRATGLALKTADYVITEAGFGSDLGGEKFLDIKCRLAGFRPAAAVLVVTARALKYNGGANKTRLSEENLPALSAGLCNLEAHIDNLRGFGLPVVVAVNRFECDTAPELEAMAECCRQKGADFAPCEVFAKGGEGGLELAQKVSEACEKENHFAPVYDLNHTIEEKIEAVAKRVYGASGVNYTPAARKQLVEIRAAGGETLPVCLAKTQYSLSDDPAKLGRPKNFTVTVRELWLRNGAGFVTALLGDIMTMPGLPVSPAAERIDVARGKITGLF
ncbi:MAG: formate--tetrahydrofolate ligase [Oscillospiraceae bacterium]|jgi:formate--tetrahydrofolate ligase|nr:formate--tetrahydrofolate ligase [Oscillospiraceae bacterium]